MPLIELEHHTGRKIWINPEQVTTLQPVPDDPNETSVNMTDAKAHLVKGRVADIAAKLNAAWKPPVVGD